MHLTLRELVDMDLFYRVSLICELDIQGTLTDVIVLLGWFQENKYVYKSFYPWLRRSVKYKVKDCTQLTETRDVDPMLG